MMEKIFVISQHTCSSAFLGETLIALFILSITSSANLRKSDKDLLARLVPSSEVRHLSEVLVH